MSILCVPLVLSSCFVSTGRVSLVRITTLRLERLQLEDQGSYDCRMLLLNKPTDEQRHGNWTWLSVMGEVAPDVCLESSPDTLCVFIVEANVSLLPFLVYHFNKTWTEAFWAIQSASEAWTFPECMVCIATPKQEASNICLLGSLCEVWIFFPVHASICPRSSGYLTRPQHMQSG